MVNTKNKIQCEICGLCYKQITSTHLKFHEITLAEYKKLYPNSPIVSSEISQKLIKANEKKWSDPEYKEKVANTISKVIKDQWENGKYITKSIGVYISKELHQHIRHNLRIGKNMGEINVLAIQFINGGL
jgi:hypothetical protein